MNEGERMKTSVRVTGAAIVREHESVTGHSGRLQTKADDLFQLPPLNSVLVKPSSRFGRFDTYTRRGCAAAGLALHDAALVISGRPVAFILAGQYGSFVTDLAFYETTAGNGQFASPNLFSYTLPNIMIGESALQFGLTGPTYCLDSDQGRGLAALSEGAWLLERKDADAVLVGWLEVPPAGRGAGGEGAMMLVLERKTAGRDFLLELAMDPCGRPAFADGRAINDMADVLRELHMADDWK
jgi:3-oxoacyl-(acyl-carrier-protein) synthase